jgi:hypothetical protein
MVWCMGLAGSIRRPGPRRPCYRRGVRLAGGLPGLGGVTKVPLPCEVRMIPRSRSTAIAWRTVVYATPYSSAKARSLGSFAVISPSAIRRWISSATWT